MEGLGASVLVGGTRAWLVQGSAGFYLCVGFSFVLFCLCLYNCFVCVFILFVRFCFVYDNNIDFELN